MASRNDYALDSDDMEDAADVEALLAQIESEKIPDRLLVLAQQLQRALNLRKVGALEGGEQN